MEVFGLSIKLKEEGAAAVDAAIKKLNLSAVAVGAALGVGLVAAMKKVVDESIIMQNAQAQLAAAIRSTGGAAGQSVDSLNEHAAAMQRVSIYGDDAVTKAQSLLLTFTKIQGDTFPKATEAVLNVATAMGSDLQSAAIQVGKALNDPILGVTALARSGIQFTESQKATIKSLVETGQQAEAQRLILAELEVQFGGSAKAARDTLGGALAGVSNAFGDMFEVSRDSSQGIVSALNAVEGALRIFDKVIRTAFEYAIPALLAFGSALVAVKFSAITALVGTLGTSLLALTAKLSAATIAQYALNTAMKANVLGVIITALGLAAAALTIYSNKTDEATEASDKASKANLDYQAALAIRKRRTEEATRADANAGLTADQLRAKIVELTRTEQILNAERLKAGNDLVGINVIEEALQRNRAALAATTATLAQVTTTAGEAERKRLDNLVALTGLTELTRAEFGQLLAMESGYAAALARGNLSVAARVDLLQKQKAALDALATSTMQGEAARMAAIGGQRSQSAGLERRPIERSGVTEPPALDVRASATPLPSGVGTGLADSIRKTGEQARTAMQAEADKLAVDLQNSFAQSITSGIGDGIASGFAALTAPGGTIGKAFNAFSGMMLGGLGDAMIRFGTASVGFAKLQAKIMSGLSSLNPATTIASAVAMIALGGALKGAAAGMFQRGTGGVGITATGGGGGTGFGMGGQGDGTVTRLLFGQTSATTAAGMQPRTATNVTIIGPDDPKAQRAIEELITKGQRRGTLG